MDKYVKLSIIIAIVLFPILVKLDGLIFGLEPRRFLTASLLEMSCFIFGLIIGSLIEYKRRKNE